MGKSPFSMGKSPLFVCLPEGTYFSPGFDPWDPPHSGCPDDDVALVGRDAVHRAATFDDLTKKTSPTLGDVSPLTSIINTTCDNYYN